MSGRWAPASDKPIQQTQPSNLGTRLNTAIVVGGEDLQPITRSRPAGEAHQEVDEVAEGQLALLWRRRNEAPLASQNRRGKDRRTSSNSFRRLSA